MRTLAIVTQVFPPKGGAGVQRILKFALYLKDHGWKTVVVAPEYPSGLSWVDESQLELIPSSDVIRVKMARPNKSLPARVVRRFLPIDAHYFWCRDVIKDLNKRSIFSPDVLLSTGPPHSVHIVGKELLRRRGIPWIADFRDHYTLNPEYRPTSLFHRRFDHWFERTTLEQAAAVICNTRTNRRELLSRYGMRFAKKTATIYNGFDLADYADQLNVPSVVNEFSIDKTNYLYLGGLRGGAIDDTFFSGLAKLVENHEAVSRQMQIHVIGDSSRRTFSCERMVDLGLVKLHEPVPATSMKPVLAHADACLTWQRDRERYRGTVAGKVYDYLAFGKPVFALGQPGGEVDRLLRRFHLGVCVRPQGDEFVAQQFAKFQSDLLENKYRLEETERSNRERFSRQYQTRQLASLLNRVVEA